MALTLLSGVLQKLRRPEQEPEICCWAGASMFIQELSIDGFKSYAQRVTVPHFDRFFNAITGLNGSGKSNILDSICFVLGITDLKQVSCCWGWA